MRSLVQAALLALVIERPSYGGEIVGRYEDRFFGLLGSGRHHLYDALRRLRAQGLIELTLIELEDGTTREGLRATALGAQRYRVWLRAPIEISHDTRRQVMIRLACVRASDIETIEYLLERYELAVLELARRRPVQSDNLVLRAVDEERRAAAGGKLNWVAWMRDELREQARELGR